LGRCWRTPAADRPEHLLRHQDPPTLGAVDQRRRDHGADRPGARGRLRRLRRPQRPRRAARNHGCPAAPRIPGRTWSIARSPRPRHTPCGSPTSPTARPSPAGCTPPSSSSCTPAGRGLAAVEELRTDLALDVHQLVQPPPTARRDRTCPPGRVRGHPLPSQFRAHPSERQFKASTELGAGHGVHTGPQSPAVSRCRERSCSALADQIGQLLNVAVERVALLDEPPTG